jgi:hypothetical protein
MNLENAKLIALEYKDKFEKETGNKVIFITVSGSKLYGTDNEFSDIDFKGLFIQSKESLLTKTDLKFWENNSNNTKEKNTKDDIDFSIDSIHKFFGLLEKGESGSIDTLFSMFRDETIMFQDEKYVDLIRDNYINLINKDMKSLIGYCVNQSKLYGIKGAKYNELDFFVKEFINKLSPDIINKNTKLSTIFESIDKFIIEHNLKYVKFLMAPGSRKIDNGSDILYISLLGKMFEGNTNIEYFKERIMHIYLQFGNRTKTIAKEKVDYKSLYSALRIAMETEELLSTKFIFFPLSTKEVLKDVKEGKVEADEIYSMISEILERVEVLEGSTKLPEKSNLTNEFIMKFFE